MRLYELFMRTLSPVLIVERKGATGFMGISSGLIPGSTMRGALLTALMSLGIRDVEEESVKPSIAITLARPPDCLISHGLSMRFKLDGAFYTLVGQENVRRMWEEGFVGVAEEALKLAGERGALSLLTTQAGALLRRCEDGSWRELSGDVLISTSVAISRRRGAAEMGMLFHSMSVGPGMRLTARLVDSTDRLEKWLGEVGEALKGLELRVGRGISRGFGKLLIDDVKEVSVEDKAEELASSISELYSASGHVVLVADGPACSLELSEKGIWSSPMPNDVRLPTKWMKAYPQVQQASPCKLKLEEGGGPHGSLMTIKGFSLRSGRPKPWLRASGPGTLARYRAEGDIRQLAYSCIMGLNELSCLGMNFFSPFTKDELPHVSEVEMP